MDRNEYPRIVVIGAGTGGLAAAATLAKVGLNVTVLEANAYPGGCAGTFFHKGFHFDAGATVAGGFYPGGPMDLVAKMAGVRKWPIWDTDIPMIVHLPDGSNVVRYGDERRWSEHVNHFGADSIDFWNWQERTADVLWDLALRLPSWPPQTFDQIARLGTTGVSWLKMLGNKKQIVMLAKDAIKPLVSHLPAKIKRLHLFVDGQLLISAQTTSRYANSLFGASALDLPRRGIVHLKGGIGAIANTLVDALKDHGGTIYFHKVVNEIIISNDRIKAVSTKSGDIFPASIVIANLTPWNLSSIIESNRYPKLNNLQFKPKDGWGAFMVYVGLDNDVIPLKFPLHHQVIRQTPLAEGNSIFLSLNPSYDDGRAPAGKRAMTISTHTNPHKWWNLYQTNRNTYEEYKKDFTHRILEAAEIAIPGISQAATLVLPGTPVTFQRFTRRKLGWVGGYPQTSLFRHWGPKIGHNLWMVGDTIFPGQSTVATALGGIRVARDILSEIGYTIEYSMKSPIINSWN